MALQEMELDAERERAYACAHLVWVRSDPDDPDSKPEPGPFCRNPLGVVSMHDCPVLLGAECRQFEERADEPASIAEEELEEIRQELLPDYLRWVYWRRVGDLRKDPADLPEPIVLEVKEKPEPEEEPEIEYTPPPPSEEAAEEVEAEKAAGKPVEEQYPGQKRSEDRRQPIKPRKKAFQVVDGDDEGGEVEAPGPKTVDEILAETPEARMDVPKRKSGGDRKSPGGRRRRRSRGRKPKAGDGEAKAAKGGDRGGRKPKAASGPAGKPKAGAPKAGGAQAEGGGDGSGKRKRRRGRRRGKRRGKGSGGGGSGGDSGGKGGGDA